MNDDATLLTLKAEDGILSQGLQVAFRGWKKEMEKKCRPDFIYSKALLTFRTIG